MTRKILERAAVVSAAVRMADEQGLDAVTMRGLAAHIGVQAMTLYRYVAGREALLDAMVAGVLDELAVGAHPHTLSAVSGASGPAFLERAARDVRRLALAHPWMIRLLVLRPTPDPALAAPLSTLASAETVLAALADHGMTRADSAQAYRAFCAFVLGHLLLEIPVPKPRADQRSPPRPPPPQPLHGYPQLAGHRGQLHAPDYTAEFENALSLFLLYLDRRHTATHIPAAPLLSTPSPEGPPL